MPGSVTSVFSEAQDFEAALRAEGGAGLLVTGRGAFRARAVVGETVKRGVVVALGVWWNRYTPDGVNGNSTTCTRLTDLGGGATFFDNLVEVERAG